MILPSRLVAPCAGHFVATVKPPNEPQRFGRDTRAPRRMHWPRDQTWAIATVRQHRSGPRERGRQAALPAGFSARGFLRRIDGGLAWLSRLALGRFSL